MYPPLVSRDGASQVEEAMLAHCLQNLLWQADIVRGADRQLYHSTTEQQQQQQQF